MLQRPEGSRVLDVNLGNWIDAGAFHLDAGVRLDPLSLTFVLLVTFVGTLIHIYAVAYMEHDADRRRFFAYLNLFIAAMLTLVLANSYLLLFFGWEGVGLASYLLIGFWNYRLDYAVAAKKAFVANRIGDLGLIIAMGLMFATFGSVSFDSVLGGVTATTSQATLNGIAIMLLLAACGKSAQFPLQSWLGDAMAGPTPVSALIHAATMVTAGVYLIVRSAPLFNAAPDAQLVVVCVGAVTLVFGAIVGCAKDDIKKALAASTMSQIGYMVLAAGLGPVGYAFAIFHLVTHGFFKAGMFLGAGSVMHGMDDQVNMRHFGGLARYMKITYITFGCGLARDHGRPAVLRLLQQGPHHRGGVRPGGGRAVAGLGLRVRRAAGRGDHRVLHVPPVLHDVRGREALVGQGRREPPAPARVPEAHDLADDRAGRRVVRARAGTSTPASKFVDWLSPVLGHPDRRRSRRLRPSC